jgi:mannosylglycoprotein endo-beta-mannosidase
MGKQSLYNVNINIDVKGFGESDSWSHYFGFRKIESHIDGATGGRYNFFNAVIFKCSLKLFL